MPTQPASFLPPRMGPPRMGPSLQPPRRPPLFAWLALLLFLLLAWSVWWFFEYKIQQLEQQTNGMTAPP